MLFPGEIVYDDSNFAQLVGDGEAVFAGGEPRLLSRVPPDPNRPPLMACAEFEAVFPLIDESEWDDRIEAQIKSLTRCSDYETWDSYDQNGLPQCWSDGMCSSASLARVQAGYPYIQISSSSLAVPINGGRSGGYEGDAWDYLVKHGGVRVELWGNNEVNRSKMNDPKCIADRENFKGLEAYKISGKNFKAYVTAALLSLPGGIAYNDWRHVVGARDVVRIAKGKYGLRIRNNWSERWGAKNRHGKGGYATFEYGARQHGCPDSGVFVRQMTAFAA